MNTIKNYLACIAPFWFYLFDIVLSLIGAQYSSEDIMQHVVTGVLVFVYVIVIYLLDLLSRSRITMLELGLFATILLFFLFYMFSGVYYWGKYAHLMPIMRKSILYTLNGVLPFYIIARERCFDVLKKVILGFALFASLVIAYRMIPQMGNGWQSVEYYGTLRYQTMGYLCAVVAVVLEVYITSCKRLALKIVYCMLLSTNFISLLLTGARGAMIAFILVSLFVLKGSVRKFSLITVIKFGFLGVAAIVAVVVAVINIPQLQQLVGGATRTFNYISDSGISLENREVIFADGIKLIMASPITGYGFGAAYYYLGIFPHNLFAEFMIDGGIFYTVAMVLLLINRAFKWLGCYRGHEALQGIFVIILINSLRLLLSGSYYLEQWFWLFVFYPHALTNNQYIENIPLETE